MHHLAKKIWTYTILIIVMGFIALYSASYQNARVEQGVFYDQLLCAAIGILIMYLIGKMDYRRFYEGAYIFYIFNVVLLILVLLAGRHALGARRWIEIAGLSFQPSELSKLALILILARYLSNRRPKLSFDFLSQTQILWKDLIIPFGFTMILMIPIFKQPDLGTAILLFGIFIFILFASGIEHRYFFGFLGVCLSFMPFLWHILKPYQKNRLLVFLNPNIDPLGAGYTIIQSKIAIGSGQIFGKGWLAGTRNQLNFLPERHTDFVFSVIGEEWGLVGCLFLLYCYFMLINTSLDIANQVKDRFGTLMCTGIVSVLVLQVVINIGMVMGLLPVVGITLPMVSYGRTSFLIFIIMMGFLLNLSKRRTVF